MTLLLYSTCTSNKKNRYRRENKAAVPVAVLLAERMFSTFSLVQPFQDYLPADTDISSPQNGFALAKVDLRVRVVSLDDLTPTCRESHVAVVESVELCIKYFIDPPCFSSYV